MKRLARRLTAAAGMLAVGLASGDRAAQLRQIEILSETLPSGYGLILARTPPVPGQDARIYVASYVLHGSMEESRLGLAHLMEHVAANNRSTIAGPTRPEVIRPFDSNALTRPYFTSFVSIVPLLLLPSAVHSRMARAGRVADDPKVFEDQVGNVIAELERDASGQFPAYKALAALALGRSPRLADEIAEVRNVGQQQATAERSRVYHPDRAILVIAGEIDLDETRKLVHVTETQLRLAELLRTPRSKTSPPLLRTGSAAVAAGQNLTAQHIVGIAWPKPPLEHPDLLPLLIADQLLLGRGGSIEDPARSAASPFARQLGDVLGASSLWDGRAGSWGTSSLVDTGPALMAIIFNTDQDLTSDQVRRGVRKALRRIWSTMTGDAEIVNAREALAGYYESWMLESSHRILSDQFMAYRAIGRNPSEVMRIPDEIRRIRPEAVRTVLDRYLLQVSPLIVILPRQ